LSETSTGNVSRVSVIRATTDSPMSPPPITMTTTPSVQSRSSLLRSGHIAGGSIYSGPRTVLDIWINLTSAEQRSREMRQEFAGRITGEGTAGVVALPNCIRTWRMAIVGQGDPPWLVGHIWPDWCLSAWILDFSVCVNKFELL